MHITIRIHLIVFLSNTFLFHFIQIPVDSRIENINILARLSKLYSCDDNQPEIVVRIRRKRLLCQGYQDSPVISLVLSRIERVLSVLSEVDGESVCRREVNRGRWSTRTCDWLTMIHL